MPSNVWKLENRRKVNPVIFLFNFQLQLSEVISNARKYMEEIAGGAGNVLTHHKTIKDLEKYFGRMSDNKDVKDFIKNITSDKEGWVFCCCC